jgi:hypothetical protein
MPRPVPFNNHAEYEDKPHFPDSDQPHGGRASRSPLPLNAVRVQEQGMEDAVKELPQELTARRDRVPDETLQVTCVTPMTIICILGHARTEASAPQRRSYYV